MENNLCEKNTEKQSEEFDKKESRRYNVSVSKSHP